MTPSRSFACTVTTCWLQQVVASGGEFPVSIAVHGDLVYVLNAGDQGSVQGYWLWGDHLWRMRFSHRALGLGNTNPPDFLHSPGQVGFTPDGQRLIVTTKASTSAIDVFWVGRRGVLSSSPVSNFPASPVPFAFTFDPMGRLVVVEAAMSHLSTYSVNPDNSLTTIGSAADGQMAACWISAARGFYYISNAASGNLSSFMLNGSGVPVLVNAMAATVQAGVTDSVTTPDQRFLYVECGGPGTIDAFHVNHDGTLTLIQTITGLPSPLRRDRPQLKRLTALWRPARLGRHSGPRHSPAGAVSQWRARSTAWRRPRRQSRPWPRPPPCFSVWCA